MLPGGLNKLAADAVIGFNPGMKRRVCYNRLVLSADTLQCVGGDNNALLMIFMQRVGAAPQSQSTDIQQLYTGLTASR